MATTKPRLIITLNPEVYEIYKKLAKAQGRPMSKLAKEQLEFMAPSLKKVLSFQEKIEQTTEQKRKSFEHASEKVDETMSAFFGLFEGIFDAIEEAVDGEALPGPRRGGKAAQTAAKVPKSHLPKLVEVDGQISGKRPPSSNTGVTI
jgi:DNA-binding protein H-NS